MHNSEARSKFIKILSESGAIGYASRKVGISHSTIYRWRKDNLAFRKAMEEAESEARTVRVENVESVLYARAMKGDVNAGKYYLEHNSARYNKRSKVAPDDKVMVDKKEYERFLRNKPLDPTVKTAVMNALKNWGITDSAKKEIDGLLGKKKK